MKKVRVSEFLELNPELENEFYYTDSANGYGPLLKFFWAEDGRVYGNVYNGETKLYIREMYVKGFKCVLNFEQKQGYEVHVYVTSPK